jgi:hypothetical protein
VIVDVVQVIHDDDQPAAGIAPPQAPEGVAHVGHPLATAEHAAEAIGVYVVEAQKLLGSLAAMIGRAHPLGPPLARPGAAASSGRSSSGPHSSKQITAARGRHVR